MSKFNVNVRVYGLWVVDNQVLLSNEKVNGLEVIKFPGGGLEYGEGTIDCLKREWMEELNINIEVLQHFYTTDFYQPSAFDNSQVLSIYYLVRPTVPLTIPLTNAEGTTFSFEPISTFLHNIVSLPIDKHVALLLQRK